MRFGTDQMRSRRGHTHRIRYRSYAVLQLPSQFTISVKGGSIIFNRFTNFVLISLFRSQSLPLIYFVSIYRYSSSLDYPMFLGYPTRGGRWNFEIIELSSIMISRARGNIMSLTMLRSFGFSPTRSGWKQFKWGISISLTRFRRDPLILTTRRKLHFFRISY